MQKHSYSYKALYNKQLQYQNLCCYHPLLHTDSTREIYTFAPAIMPTPLAGTNIKNYLPPPMRNVYVPIVAAESTPFCDAMPSVWNRKTQL